MMFPSVLEQPAHLFATMLQFHAQKLCSGQTIVVLSWVVQQHYYFWPVFHHVLSASPHEEGLLHCGQLEFMIATRAGCCT